MIARDIMQTEVVTVLETDTVRHAGGVLFDTGYAALPVLDVDGGVVGLITEADILGLTIPEYLKTVGDLSFLPKSELFPLPGSVDLDALTVGQVMQQAILRTVTPDEPVIELARIMVREHVRRCPVVEDGRLVGIVGRRDLMEIIVRPALEGTSQHEPG